MKTGKKKKEVRDDAIKALRYLIRGVRASDFAVLEGWEAGRAQWLLREGGRILEGEIKLITHEGLLRELILNHQERKRQLWNTFLATTNDAIKIAAMRLLGDEDEKMLDLAERMGIVKQKAALIEGNLTWAEVIKLADSITDPAPVGPKDTSSEAASGQSTA